LCFWKLRFTIICSFIRQNEIDEVKVSYLKLNIVTVYHTLSQQYKKDAFTEPIYNQPHEPCELFWENSDLPQFFDGASK